MTFNREARDAYLAFAMSSEGEWRANFRDLASSVTRMATLCTDGRIDMPVVGDEIGRLRRLWAVPSARASRPPHADVLRSAMGPRADDVDPFDVPQLALVIRTCRTAPTLSEAGRRLFSVSRAAKKTNNDADRLKKYLASHGLAFSDLCG